jgi:hypothetical protein
LVGTRSTASPNLIYKWDAVERVPTESFLDPLDDFVGDFVG